ncbi:MAG: hypothetical protein QXJ27_07495, partial [Thermoplasmata archaeon]
LESGEDRFKDWGPLDVLFNIANGHGKKCAIMETGFSTWASEDTSWWSVPAYWHTEDDQENFINTALPIIREKSHNQNWCHPQNKMLLSCWYELRDENTGAWGWWQAEQHFGILHDNLSFKRGYDDTQWQIFSFYSS